MKESKLSPKRLRPVWVMLALLAGLGLYSLLTWGFFMFEGGWQIGLACLVLLMAPVALIGRCRSGSPGVSAKGNDGRPD